MWDGRKKTLEDRYLLAGESYQDMFARVATAYADDVRAAVDAVRGEQVRTVDVVPPVTANLDEAAKKE